MGPIGTTSYPKSIRLKPVINRTNNFANHPALAQQQKNSTINFKSTTVGPTIKSASRLSAYLPDIA